MNAIDDRTEMYEMLQLEAEKISSHYERFKPNYEFNIRNI